MSSSIQASWHRVEQWLSDNATPVLHSLNGPASESQIDDLERSLGVQLPTDFRASLMIHNGQVLDSIDGSVPGIIDGYELLNLDRVIQEYKGWSDLLSDGVFAEATAHGAPGVGSFWWNVKWVPIAYNGSGDNYCIDLDPSPHGSLGQIIHVQHDDPHRSLLAGSFREWLQSFADGLWAGAYVYSEEMGGNMREEDV